MIALVVLTASVWHQCATAQTTTMPTIGVGGGTLSWHRDIAAARAAADVSGRQVLVIFTAGWNETSSRFEIELARSNEAMLVIGSCFEPVRINASDDPWTTRRMGVSNVPAACIIDSHQTVLAAFECPDAPALFLAALCKASQQAAVASVSQDASSHRPPRQPHAAAFTPAGRVPVDPPEIANAVAPTTRGEPLGLDGFCPVSIVTRQSWVQGNPQITCVHLGRTYRFSSDAERRAFLANPEWYAPALGGDDPVIAAERGMAVAGRRACSASYRSRLYLFTSPDTRHAFLANPEHYLSRSQPQIARGTTSNRGVR